MISMSRRLAASLCLFLVLIAVSPGALAWGKRGHAMICETAAYLIADSSHAEFLKDRSFDLGYYCNVPDIIWKRPKHYQDEWFNHFMDMEIFERELKKDEMPKALLTQSRVEFETSHPNVRESAGRSFWRIDELMSRADKLTADLKKTDLSREERHRLQADWLVTIGTLGHYVGDLAQPLHITENYDGQLTEQKGVHAWFEDDAVNELYLGNGPALDGEVMKAASEKWKKLGPKWRKMPVRELLWEVAGESNKKLAELLKIDKKTGRKDLKKAALAFRPMIVERLATGTVALAALWNRELGWNFDGVKFYTFVAEPDFIPYEKPQPTATPTPKN